jgi:hypothetical protein
VLARGTAQFGPRVEGKLIVNMGTHAPAWSKALEAELIAAGARFVEAPVSGSRGPAEAGELVAMLAGDPTGIEQLRPFLKHLCRQTVTTGAVPSAMACKIQPPSVDTRRMQKRGPCCRRGRHSRYRCPCNGFGAVAVRECATKRRSGARYGRCDHRV